MGAEYDFSKARPNPYVKRLKKQITIRLDEFTVGYFKSLSEEAGIPYQTLINLYLRDCAGQRRELDLVWRSERAQRRQARVKKSGTTHPSA